MKNNLENNNIENNTLSIIDSPISIDNTITNNKLNNSEDIPIKQLKKINIKTPEEYYSTFYPEYKLFKINGFLFCKIGKLITFNFDKNNNFTPKFSIGPHWYMTLFLHVLIIILECVIYIFIIKMLHYFFLIGFIFVIIIAIIMVDRASLIHPDIAMNKIPDNYNNSFCNKCKVYFNIHDKVTHCNFCEVCIKNLDHHCVWIGKCVGKNNLCPFYQMLIATSFLYIYIIICIIIYSINN